MQYEEENPKSEFSSYNLTPEKLQKTPRGSGSGRRDIMSQNVERRIHYTPQNSPDKFVKTPQSGGSFRKDEKSQLESNKRKIQSSHNESLEKIQKTCPTGKFVNTLIGQWSKHVGVQTPMSQRTEIQESPMSEEIKRICTIEERKIQKLQKKLQAAEETISLLSASHEAELRAKEEILQQLNGDWESITKYYYEISESLKGFQQHKDNLSALYNNVIVEQQSTVKKLQQELSSMKLKDEEHKNTISTVENKVINQEKRIQEMMIAEFELKKQLEEMNKSILEENHLHKIHAEENLELIKKQENLTSMNQELQVQLKNIIQEKQNLANVFTEKDKEISKLQEELVTCKNKIEDLLCQNMELIAKYEKSTDKEEELSKQLQSRAQEIDRLRENLSARQEIESSLVKDLNIIDNEYKKIQNDFAQVENELKKAHACNLKERVQPVAKSNVIEVTKEIGNYTQMSQVYETNEQQSQSQKSVGMPNITSRDKSEISNPEQDIYNFNTTKIYNELENVLSPTKQDKKIQFDLNPPVKVKFII
ncbi:PREDICTED: CAP-Gly domain-containing linker protein 1-like [Habropoda laboriosa]|uniref:CAP-Gly domain-containing linker protein 1-like n=1 Tax=Habropoda laboriosa TaxID=597456 RepID=UPI00083D96A0|nr:PREDICTED: CAP-Gly domain-containing linker protein 1-like [Habropoda laboriosa]